MPRSYRCGKCNKLFLSLGYVLDHSTVCNKSTIIIQPKNIQPNTIIQPKIIKLDNVKLNSI